MGRYVALLRGVNVGGKNRVPMAELNELFETHGFREVKTYINSGNIIFADNHATKAELKEVCETLIFNKFKLAIPVAVISAEELITMSAHTPEWWGETKEAKHNALFVIPPVTAKEVLEAFGPIKPEYEKVAYYDSVIFWTAGMENFSRTSWSKIVGTKPYSQVTIRNANTFNKLVQLIQS